MKTLELKDGKSEVTHTFKNGETIKFNISKKDLSDTLPDLAIHHFM